ncbi:hypothetical protein Bca4012_084028 [Brassica carinata]
MGIDKRGLFEERYLIGFYLRVKWALESALLPYPKVVWIVKRCFLSDYEVLVTSGVVSFGRP